MKVIGKIEGMHCEGCVKRIENSLEKLEGVLSYKVELESKTLELEIENETVLDEVKEKIENLGFSIQIN